MAALNTSHKDYLGVLSEGRLQTVEKKNGVEQTDITLKQSNATGNNVGIKIINPKTGAPIYVELRGGLNRDDQSFYKTFETNFLAPDYSRGVKVMYETDEGDQLPFKTLCRCEKKTCRS